VGSVCEEDNSESLFEVNEENRIECTSITLELLLSDEELTSDTKIFKLFKIIFTK
jgi:hypothetical protein